MTDELLGSIITAGTPLLQAFITIGAQLLKRNPDMTAEDLAVLVKANAQKVLTISDQTDAEIKADQTAHLVPPADPLQP
jgi:hypothetical protein